MIYNLISETTGEIVGYTTIGPFDTDHISMWKHSNILRDKEE